MLIMKEKLTIVLLLMASLSFATVRTPEQAMRVAESYLNSYSSATMRATAHQPMRVAYVHPMNESDDPAVYVMQLGEDKGYVLVSGNDVARDVLGYVEDGAFDEEAMPDAMRVWLGFYAEQIAMAAARGVSAPAKNRTAVAVQPLLNGISWGQNAPFNAHCPTVSGTATKAGCVAVACAQVMRYWQYPTHGTGSHSYTWRGQTLSADFGATTYDWANMLKSYAGSYTTTQANAVAKLVYHIGVAAEASYGTGSTGATSADAIEAMTTFFGYDKGIRTVAVDYEGTALMEQVATAEITARRPFIISAATKFNEGHAFVCDGINSEGLFSINWGWTGKSDGYFVLSALDPDEQGTGGADSQAGYSTRVCGFFGLQQNIGSQPNMRAGAMLFGLLTDKTASTTNKVTCRLSKLSNIGAFTWPADEMKIGIGVYRDGQFLQWLGYRVPSSDISPSTYWSTYTLEGMIDNLSSGNYELIPTYEYDGIRSKMPVGLGDKTIPFTISGSVATFSTTNDSQLDYSIRDLDVTLSSSGILRVGYKSDAQRFMAQVIGPTSQDTVYNKQVSAPYFSAQLENYGSYRVRVRPINDKGEYVASWQECLVEWVDYSIKNLTAEVDENKILHISFDSPAPTFRVILTLGNDTLANSKVATTSLNYKTPLTTTGLYTIFVRPRTVDGTWLAPGVTTTYYFDYNGIDDVFDSNETIYYDLLGRPVMHPEHGSLYIRRRGGEAKTILFY